MLKNLNYHRIDNKRYLILLFVNLTLISGLIGQTASITNGSNSETVDIASTIVADPGVLVFDFNIVHDGGNPNQVRFDEIAFDIDDTDTDITDWSEVIVGAQIDDLTDGFSKDNDVSITANQIQFTSINDTELGAIDGGATGETKSYTLSIWFNSAMDASIAALIDGKQIIISIDENSFNVTNGTINSSSAISTNGNAANNTIDVDATEYRFLEQPTNTATNIVMSPAVTLEATDVNGNRDLDYNNITESSPVQITTNSGTATLSGTPTVANASDWVSGVGTVSDIVHTTTGTNTLGLTNGDLTNTATSNSFNITVDVTSPTIASITRDDADPTNIDAVSWTVTFADDFSTALSGVDDSDFTITGGTGIGASITGFTGLVYTVEASGGDLATLDGTITLNISGAADNIEDAAGNDLDITAPATNENSYVIDNASPTLSNVSTRPDFATAVDLTYQSNEAGTIFWALYTSDPTVSDADVIAGTGASDFGSFAVGGVGTDQVENISLTLTNGTGYFIALIAQDDAGNNSAVEESSWTADNVSPEISSISVAGDNSYIDVVFDEPVYNTGGGSGALEAADFDISITGGTASFDAITSITQNDGSTPLTGGETIIRIFFSTTGGTADGDETLEVDLADGSSVFDLAGNSASATQTSPANQVSLNNQTFPTFVSAAAISSSLVQVTFSKDINSVTESDGSDFTISGLTITGASINGSNSAIIDLAISAGISGTDYTSAGGLDIAASAVTDVDALDNQIISSQNVDDGQSPVLVSASTEDVDANGQIDQLVLTFSEDIDQSDLDAAENSTGVTDDFTVDGGSGFSISGVDTDTGLDSDVVVISLTESGAADTDATPTLAIAGGTFSDLSSLENLVDAVGSSAVADGAGAVIISAVTGDDDGDGEIDEIVVTFSEPIEAGDLDETATGGDTDDFDITGYDISGVLPSGGSGVDGNELIISLVESGSFDTDATPAVTLVVNELNDLASSPNGNAAYTANATDGTLPILASQVTSDNDVDGQIDQLVLTFSEDIDQSDLDAAENSTGVTDDFTVDGGAGFSISGVNTDTGSDSDVVVISLTESGAADTDATPTLAIIGGTFSDLSGNLVSTVAASAVDDGAGAVVISVVTDDVDDDGEIDELLLTLSEPIEAGDLDETATGGDTDEFDITGYNISGVLPSGGSGVDGNQLVISLVESGSFDTDATPAVTLVVNELNDLASSPNGNAAYTANATDGALPILASQVTSDNDVDGQIDQLVLTFSEDIDQSDLDAAENSTGVTDDFTVDGGSGFSISGVDTDTGLDSDVVVISLTESGAADTDATPTLAITGGTFSDLSGNLVSTVAASAVDDGAPPAIIDVAFYDDASNDGLIDRLVFTWSEATSAVDGTLSTNDFGGATGFVTFADGSEADFSDVGAVFSGNGTTTMDITGIVGQVSPATSINDIYTANDPATFSVDGITAEFTDGTNVTIDPDNNETFTDNAAPILIGSTPVNGDVAGVGTNIDLIFSEQVVEGAGASATTFVTVTDETDGDKTQSMAVTTAATYDVDTVTIDITTDLDNSEDYSVQIDVIAFDDVSGNSYAGIIDNTTYTFETVEESDLEPGDIAFVGYNSDDNELAVVVLVDINGGSSPQEIRFTDQEWSGSAFETEGGDGEHIWTINEDIAAGTVIEFTNLNSTAPAINPSTGAGSISSGSEMNLATTIGEGVFAYVGTGPNGVSVILAGLSTAGTDDGTNGWGGQDLNGTGLVEGVTAVDLGDIDPELDGANYNGSRDSENDFADYLPFINDPSNWQTADGGTANPTFNLDDFTIDVTAPTVTSITRSNPTDEVTNATTVTFEITFSEDVAGVAASDFTIAAGGATADTPGALSGSDDTYTIQFSNVAEGGTDVLDLDIVTTGSIVDLAGNDFVDATPTGTEETYTIDQTAPEVTDLEIFDTDGDGFIDQIDITFSENIDTDNGATPVTADLGTLTLPDGVVVGSTADPTISDPAGAGNVVSVTVIVDQEDANTAVGLTDIDGLTGFWEDNAGNTILAAGDDSETITDSAVPVLASSSPIDNASSAGITDNIILTFSEDIQAGTGNILINDISNGGTFETFDVTTDVSIVSNTVTIDPAIDFTLNDEYAVQVAITAIDELGNTANSYAGITNDDDLDFIVNNIAPEPCSPAFDYIGQGGGTGDTDGHVSPSNCNVEPTDISSIATSQTNAVSVFFFNMVSGNQYNEAFSDIVFTNENTTVQWANVIAGAELINEFGASTLADNITNTTIEFNLDPEEYENEVPGVVGHIDGNGNFTGAGGEGAEGDAPNGIEFALRIWLNDNIPDADAAIIDGESVHISLSLGDITSENASRFIEYIWDGTSWSDDAAVGFQTDPARNIIDVEATDYRFFNQPVDADENSIMPTTVTLEATDENGNRDLDYDNVADAVQITSTGTVNPVPSVENASDWVSGIGSVNDIIHIAPGGPFTLGTTGGALDDAAASDPFNISGDVTAPAVSTISTNITTISDSDNGNSFTVEIVYNEALDGSTAPAVSFDPDITAATGTGTITFVSGAFSTGVNTNDTYTLTYTVNDVNEEITGVDVSANGAVDNSAANNVQTVASTVTNVFNVDTENPTVTAIQRVSPALTNADDVDWDITFSETVAAIDEFDFSVSGTTGAPTGAADQGGNTYRVNVANGDMASLNAVITISVLGTNNITDANGNALNLGTTPSPNETTIEIDNSAPLAPVISGVTDDTGSDTGDGITNDQNLIISGTAEANSSVEVYIDAGSIGSTTTDALGSWSFDYTATTLAEGTYSITAEATDGAGNTGLLSAGFALEIDLTSPSITITSNATISDGFINVAESISDLVIVGTTSGVEDGEVVTLTLDGINYLSSSAGGINVNSGDWQVTIPSASLLALTDGDTYSIEADVADAAGNPATTDETDDFIYDGTPVTFTSATTIDSDEDGTIDQLEIVFSENITCTSCIANLSLSDGSTITSIFSSDITDVGSIVFNINASAANNTALIMDPEYAIVGGSTILDNSGNEMASGETVTGSDGAGPVIIAARTLDSDTDGLIDGIIVTLSESILDASSTFNATTFDVDGYTDTNVSTVTADDNQVTAVFDEGSAYDTDATPQITLIAGRLQDAATNAIGSDQLFTGTADGAAPAMVIFEYQDGSPVDGQIDQFEIFFSEALSADPDDSFLSASDLFLTNDGDFDGAEFGSGPADELTVGGETSVTISLGNESSVVDTQEESGLIAVRTQNPGSGSYVLSDGVNTNTFLGDQTWVVFRDGAGPVIVNALTLDDDGNGQIDGMTITLSEPLDDGASTIDGTTFDIDSDPLDVLVDDYTGESASSGTADDDVINVTFDESGNGDTGTLPSVFLAANLLTDGNTFNVFDQTFTGTTDGAAPAIFDIEYRDVTEDGFIDALRLTYSEQVVAASFLSNEDIYLSNDGDFDGALIDADNADAIGETDLITVNTTGTTVTLEVPSSEFDTNDSDEAGDLQLGTQNNFSLQDASGNINNALVSNVVGATITDRAAPLIASATTFDSNNDGQIDGITITMSEAIEDDTPFNSTAFTVTGYANPVASTGVTGDDDLITITFTPSGTADTDATPNVVLGAGQLTDGTSTLLNPSTFSSTEDDAPPVIISATTGDTDENGQIDFIDLVFSEDINAGTVDTGAGGGFDDFSVSGYAISAVAIDGTDGIDLTLTESGTPDTDAVPEITLNGGELDDAAIPTNTLPGNVIFSGTVDGAAPAMVSVITDDSDGNGLIDMIAVTLSEDYEAASVDFSGSGSVDFVVTSYVIDRVVSGGLNALNIILDELAIPDTDATPNVTLNDAEIQDDGLTNTLSADQTLTSEDGASPVLWSSITLDTDDDGDVDLIELEFSEPVDDDMGEDAAFHVDPPVGFGGIENSGTLDTEVVNIASLDVVDDEYISISFSVNTWGTGEMTLEYQGTNFTDLSPANNRLSIPDTIVLTDGAAPRVIDQDISGDLDLVPVDDATGVPATNTLTLRYSEDVSWDAQSGTNQIDFVQLSPIEVTTFDLDNNFAGVDATATDGTVTITLPSVTNANSDYYVLIDGGAFLDNANLTSANDQFQSASFWNFQTEAALVVVNTVPSSTQITLELNDDATISADDPTDFTVTDALSNNFTVTTINDLGGNDIEIVVDLSTAVGDLTIDFDGVGTGGSGTTDITAAAGTLQDFVGELVNFDTSDPIILSGTRTTGTELVLTFDDAIQVDNATGAINGDFYVEDGGANVYAVTGIDDSDDDGTLLNTELKLSFADISTTVGDIFVTYTVNGGNDGVEDYGGNALNTQSIQIELDGNSPVFEGATVLSNTSIELDFDESVQIISASPSNEITIIDENLTTFIVSAVSDATTGDDRLEITVQDFTNAVGDLTVDINPAALDAGLVIQDFGGNSLPASSFTMDVDYNPVPTITEVFAATSNAEGDTDQGDVSDGSGLGMYRSVDKTTVINYTPIAITPKIDGDAINIYNDSQLTNLVYQETGVVGSTSPALMSIFASVQDLTDGIEDHGVFTFYITETSTATPVTEGPAIAYSIALLDTVTNTNFTQNFNNDDFADIILNNHPEDQTLQFSGNGLTTISYDPLPNSGTSSTTFLANAAGTGNHQITFEWTNDTTGVSALFIPSEFNFSVIATSDVLLTSQSLFLGKNNGASQLGVNDNQIGIDVGSIETANNDFYGIEAYHIVNGQVNTGIGGPGIHSATSALDENVYADAATGYLGGTTTDDIASILLTYDDPLNSDGGDNQLAFTDGSPAHILNEWVINPSDFTAVGATVDPQAVDTIRLVTVFAADDGSSKGVINDTEIYLFPDPIVQVVGVNNEYCEDDGDFRLEVFIRTYLEGDGSYNVDEVDFISNGYILEYYGSDDTYSTTLSIYDYTAGGTLDNFLDPSDPDKDGDRDEDETGYYRIVYTSDPQTPAALTTTTTFDFQILPVATFPILDLDATGLDLAGGISVSNDYYTFEFCEGELIPNIHMDTTVVNGTPADAVGSDANQAYTWYFDNGIIIDADTAALDMSLVFPSNPPFGTQTRNIYATRNLNGCESDSISIEVRVFETPDEPAINLTDIVDNNPSASGNLQNIYEDGGDYYFEYCYGQSEPVVFDILDITSSIADIEGRDFISDRTYFKIYDSDTITLTHVIPYNASEDYTIDFNNEDIFGAFPNTGSTAAVDANGVLSKYFFISTVVADSTFLDGSAVFEGCESALTAVTFSVYTYPDIPDFNSFTGSPQLVTDTVNYYMCQNDSANFPFVGFQPPTDALGAEFEWYTDEGLNDQIVTGNSTGQVLTFGDLRSHDDPIDPDFDAQVPGIYTYYSRLVSNINNDAGFDGCGGEVRQVNITVFSEVVKPVVSVVDDALQGDTNEDNFEHVFSFCVDAASGLADSTAFASAVTYTREYAETSEAVRWYPANGLGTVISGAQITESDENSDPQHTITADDLRLQGELNNEFYFAVLYNTDFYDDFPEWSGCFNSYDTTFVKVIVSTIPNSQFVYRGITIGQPTTFTFLDDNNSDIATGGLDFTITNESSVVIATYEASSKDDPFQHVFTTPGIYTAELSIETTAGCVDVETRTFEILDHIILEGNYVENFNSGDGGWFAEYRSDNGREGSSNDPVRISSWQSGAPAGENINATFDDAGGSWTTTALYTDDDGVALNRYLGGEISFVNSPSFDISILENPAISFYTYRDFDVSRDGVVFQYSLDNGRTWIPLGDFNASNEVAPSTGQNWFNANGIASTPGDINIEGGTGFNERRVGWTDRYSTQELEDISETNGWALSTHSLSSIAGEDSIRFRFGLSASGTTSDDKDGDGFGFDRFQLFSLEKTVLIEQFSSTLQEGSKLINESFINEEGLIDDGINSVDEVMWINYFTDFGNTSSNVDDLNVISSNGSGARAIYYGIDNSPRSVLDGEVFGQEEPDVRSWNSNDVNIKGLASTLFTIPGSRNDLSTYGIVNNSADGMLSVSATFEANTDTAIADMNLSFIFAVIEKEVRIDDLINDGVITDGNLGVYESGDIIQNVMKVLLPSPTGYNYLGDVNSNSEFTYSVDWVVDDVYDASELRVIVFVQDNSTHEVLQSGYIDVDNIGETILSIGKERNYSVYPNPADDELLVDFRELLVDDQDWVIYDQTGREIIKGAVKKGTKQFSIEIKDVSSGLYFLYMIRREEDEYDVRRVVIKH